MQHCFSEKYLTKKHGILFHSCVGKDLYLAFCLPGSRFSWQCQTYICALWQYVAATHAPERGHFVSFKNSSFTMAMTYFGSLKQLITYLGLVTCHKHRPVGGTCENPLKLENRRANFVLPWSSRGHFSCFQLVLFICYINILAA